jgi:hypothetical protein
VICTFCGTENPSGNRFCGMCGVRVERRKTERRTEPRDTATCGECGHVNETKYKFCGMCGARIDRRVQERRARAELARANAAANAQLPTPEAQRSPARRQPETAASSRVALAAPAFVESERSEPEPHEVSFPVASTGVSGPSFLGLNDAQPGADYLLEDDRPSHRGLRAVLLLIVLAAIVGLILIQYRASINGNSKSPQPPNPSPATIPNSEGQNQTPGWDHGLQTAVAAHSLQPAVASLAKAANSASNGSGVAAKQGSSSQEDDPEPGKVAGDKPDPAGPLNTKSSAALAKAQQYLHGQGVHQNCEQGLIYLRAAARENDPQAAVQMGALYSSGLCVTPNRVQAYQWFSTARDLQPDNRWIARNLDELWAKMTPQERRQIRQ